MLLHVFLFAILAQAQAAPQGEIQAITIKGQDELVYGFVEIEGQRVKITPDTPWITPRPLYKPVRDVEYEPELGNRDERLEREGRAAGYVRLESGRWIPIVEKEFADRAKAMLAQTQTADVDPEAPPQDDDVAVESPSADIVQPGGFSQWIPHIGLTLIAVLAIGTIAKTMLLTED